MNEVTDQSVNGTVNGLAGGGALMGLLVDVGVVLLRSAWEIADEFERANGLVPGTIPGRGPFDPQGDARWQAHLAGAITEREYWLGFAAAAVEAGAPLDGHPHLMRAMFQHPGVSPVRVELVALVERARAAGRRTGILTNELMDFQGRDWVEAQPWFELFDVLVDATELGVRKPNPEPYRVAVELMALPAHNIVFIDDNPRYVQGGNAAGLVSVFLDVLDPGAAISKAAALLAV